MGIPFFLITLEVVVQRRKPIPPIDEFVLRAAQGGLSSIDAVGGFLGLDPRLIETAIVNQLQGSTLSYDVTTDGTRILQVTSRGSEALVDLVAYEPQRQEIQVVFDRMLRAVTGTRDQNLVKPAALSARSLRPKPPVRPPDTLELSVDEVNTALAKAEGLRSTRRDAAAEYQLIAVKRVTRSERRYKPATILIYQAPKARSLRAGIAVDEKPSQRHTVVMADLGGLQYLEIDERELKSGMRFRRAVAAIPPELRTDLAEDAEVDKARKAYLVAGRGLRDPLTATEVSSRPDTLEARATAEAVFEARGLALQKWRVRRVRVWEHAMLLDWALSSAKRRLLIMSSNANDSVIDFALIQQLERAGQRGCEVQIVVGQGSAKPTPGEIEARRRLRELQSRRQRISFIEAPQVPSSLVWDDSWVSGDFPWLSHRGDPENRLVYGESVAVSDREVVTAELARLGGLGSQLA